MIKFPADFFWGAATSAFQVEGDNVNSDWWEWEKRAGLKETSKDACRHYEFYRQDFDLAKALFHNAHRLSVEWSRIQPQEDRFSSVEIAHYRDVILALRERGIEPIVTLHHFTNPAWFAESGGWQTGGAEKRFLRYVERIVEALCDKVRFWVTINEPLVYVYHGYILGAWPPQERSLLKAKKAADNLMAAHLGVYRLIHRIYKERDLASPLVSIAKNLQVFESCKAALRNKFAVYIRDKLFNFDFLERLIRCKSLDFIGINYYTRGLIDIEDYSFKSLFFEFCKKNHSRLKKNSLSWDIYPEGLSQLLLRLKRYNLPVFILENGISTDDDGLRWEFIYESLKNLNLAMEEGVKVLGYIYWSLLDNYEWDKGFSHRFGLVHVDYLSYQRTIKPSALKLAEVARTGILTL